MRVALTGATGAVGACFAEALRAEPDVELCAVGRAEWDLREPLPRDVVTTMRSCDVLVHAAADTRLGGPPEELQLVNVGSLRHLAAALGHGPRRPRLVYVSSAFVEGPVDQGRNAYEQSKRDAEAVVRTELPEATILRTSLVMGDSVSGRIARFGGFYTVCRMFVSGMLPAFVGRPESCLDFVPVDDVADLLLRTARAAPDLEGATVTVASGRASPALSDLVASLRARVAEYSGRDFPPTPFVSSDRYWRLFRPLIWPTLTRRQQRLLEYCELFFTYFSTDHVFDRDPDAPLVPAVRTGDDLLAILDRSLGYWLQTAQPRVTPHAAIWSAAR